MIEETGFGAEVRWLIVSALERHSIMPTYLSASF